MKNFIFSFLVGTGFLLFGCNHSEKESEADKENNRLYAEGLRPNTDVENPFYPEGQVFLCDSILSQPLPENEKQNVLYVKAVNLLYL